MTPLMSRRQQAAWFEAKQAEKPYNFAAAAPSSMIRPYQADQFGANRSLVWRRGIRMFYFETEQARDAFVRMYREAKSVPLV